ncbi:aldehyde dehydrogenase [Christensenellaceae bacterium]|nr:aldehyde dehydrogenase [Christensenellaceae bacterium]BDF61586.1 aldehyde dehydrogenase [Christensenellaceae bacterium]
MQMTEEQLKKLIASTVSGLLTHAAGNTARWLCDDMDEAVENAKLAQRQLAAMTLKQRKRIIEAIRTAGVKNADYLGKLAHEETGYGHADQKAFKNVLLAESTPGTEDIETRAVSGDEGLTLIEHAPFGVIGSIIPSTNPTSSVLNNAISMIAAGNAVVFNPHPAAKKCSQEAMRIVNEAVASAGGPQTLVTTVKEPTMESGQKMMEHRDITLLSVTGGEAVVAVAMKTGKRVIAAGPGNPPAIVDDTADIQKAAKDIIDGASFDNNVMCISEKEVFAFENIAEQLMDEMCKNGAARIYGADIDKVMKTTLIEKNGNYVINRKYVGKDAAVILRNAGVAFSGEPRIIIAEVERTHPFIMTEMLMPVLGVARVRDIDDAIASALMAEKNCKHSAVIHSMNVRHLSMAAAALNTTIFVKNGPSYAGNGFGGEGFATMTIATPTGEGQTSARTFTRTRRCVLQGDLRII